MTSEGEVIKSRIYVELVVETKSFMKSSKEVLEIPIDIYPKIN